MRPSRTPSHRRPLRLAYTILAIVVFSGVVASPARALGEEAATGAADPVQLAQDDGARVEDPLGQAQVVEDSLATDFVVTDVASPESQELGTSDASCGPIVVQSSQDEPGGETAMSLPVSAGGEGGVGLAAQATPATPHVSYRTHVQRVGWQGWKKDGKTSGTSGRSLRLEAINIKLTSKPVSGSIKYRTHVQTYGWQGWRKDGAISGTSGEAKRLEAIQIKLVGKMAKRYDVWYRVHAQSFGWMGWAKNGASAGTAGYAYRLEAIQIKLVKKGDAAPGATKGAFKQKKNYLGVYSVNLGGGASYSVAITGQSGSAIDFYIESIGRNYSPIYTTTPIHAHVTNDSVKFSWTDSWMNSGTGHIRFKSNQLVVSMTQTKAAARNRSSLSTEYTGVRVLPKV